MKKIMILLLGLLMLTTFAGASLNDSSLLHYYSFDTDSSDDVGSIDLQLQNSPTFTSSNCILGSCYDLDGINDYFNGSIMYNEVNFTVSFWFRKEVASTDFRGLISAESDGAGAENFKIVQLGGATYPDKLELRADGISGLHQTANAFPDQDVWHHVVMTYENGSNVVLYVNSSVEINTSATSMVWYPEYSYVIGRFYSDASSYYWDGRVDEFGFWNRVLTPDEVSALFTDGSGCNPITTNCEPPPTDPNFTNPIGGEVLLSSVENVTWSASYDVDTVYYNLSYSDDNSSWINLTRTTNTFYEWDISGVTDGYPYYLLVIADDAVLTSNPDYTEAFRINEDAPSQPVITYPDGGEQVDKGDTVNITWSASTSDISVNYTVDYSSNNGGSWTEIANTSNLYYEWDTIGVTSSAQYLVRVKAGDGYYVTSYDTSDAVFEISVPLVIQWDTKQPDNQTYHGNDINMYYELQTGDTDITCYFYVDGVQNLTDTHSSLGDKLFTYDITSTTPQGNVDMQVNCSSDYRTDSTSVKLIYVDTYDPTITVTSPTEGGKYYRVTGLPVVIDFNNSELEDITVLVYKDMTVKFNDTITGITGSTYSINYTVNYSDLDFEDMRIDVFSQDEAGNNVTEVVNFKIYNCTELVEDWDAYYTLCNVSDKQLLYYLDINECLTDYDFPVDNSTEDTCNYCTIQYHEEETECDTTYNKILYQQYDNFATCCNLTGISADCDLPVNETQSCVGTHDSEDIPNVIIDNVAEMGITAIDVAPLIVLVGVALLLGVAI